MWAARPAAAGVIAPRLHRYAKDCGHDLAITDFCSRVIVAVGQTRPGEASLRFGLAGPLFALCAEPRAPSSEWVLIQLG